MAEEPLPARDLRFMSRYPEVFGRGPWHDRPTPLCYGLGIGDGWMPLLDRLCEDLVRIIREDDLRGFQTRQVKEKFGGLRFYVAGGSRRTRERIDAAERESMGTCELCAAPGRIVNDDGWHRTLCAPCRSKR